MTRVGGCKVSVVPRSGFTGPTTALLAQRGCVIGRSLRRVYYDERGVPRCHKVFFSSYSFIYLIEVHENYQVLETVGRQSPIRSVLEYYPPHDQPSVSDQEVGLTHQETSLEKIREELLC